MSSTSFLTSCSSYDCQHGPIISIDVIGNPTYELGSFVEYAITITTPNQELSTISVYGASSGTISGDSWDETSKKFVSNTVQAEVNYRIQITEPVNTEINLVFIVSDSFGCEGSETASITVREVQRIKTNTITLGAQSNTVGGAAASFEGSVFTLSESAAQAAIIDILYYNGSKGAAIYAPTQSDIQEISGWDWSNWSVKNATRFVMASKSDFTEATNSSIEAVASGASLDVVANLNLDDVVAFTTINDKSGVFKVTSLDDNSEGSITIEVKILDNTNVL